MEKKKISRRDFIKAAGFTVSASVLAACAPQVVTQVVNQTQVVVQTQVVPQTQVVAQTQIVNQVVTATPAPTAVPAPAVLDVWIISPVDLTQKWTSDPNDPVFKKEWWVGGLVRQQVAAFNAKHPDVTVKVSAHSWDWDLRQNEYLALAAGLIPDTAYGEAYVGEFVNLGLYAPVGADAIAKFPPGAYRAVSKGGKVYGLAETAGANVLMINLDQLEKIGVDATKLPTNWDELLAFADAISKKNKGNAYFSYLGHPESLGAPLRMGGWFEQNNAPLGSDDGKPSLNIPGAADTWVFHNKLMYTSTVDTILDIDTHGEGATGGKSFDGGAIALKMAWSNDITYIKAKSLAIQLPFPTGGKPATGLVGMQYNSPFLHGPNPELAVEYIEITTTDEASQLVKPNGCGIWIPALKSMLESYATFDKLNGYPKAAWDNVRVTMKAFLDSGTPLPGWPKNGGRIWNAWSDSYGKIWKGNLGKDDIQKELDALEKTVEGLLNKTG